jgi:hypothetical protein
MSGGSNPRSRWRLRTARLRHGHAVVEDVDYRTPRRLDKALFQQLAAGKWIAEHRNLLWATMDISAHGKQYGCLSAQWYDL